MCVGPEHGQAAALSVAPHSHHALASCLRRRQQRGVASEREGRHLNTHTCTHTHTRAHTQAHTVENINELSQRFVCKKSQQRLEDEIIQDVHDFDDFVLPVFY